MTTETDFTSLETEGKGEVTIPTALSRALGNRRTFFIHGQDDTERVRRFAEERGLTTVEAVTDEGTFGLLVVGQLTEL